MSRPRPLSDSNFPRSADRGIPGRGASQGLCRHSGPDPQACLPAGIRPQRSPHTALAARGTGAVDSQHMLVPETRRGTAHTCLWLTLAFPWGASTKPQRQAQRLAVNRVPAPGSGPFSFLVRTSQWPGHHHPHLSAQPFLAGRERTPRSPDSHRSLCLPGPRGRLVPSRCLKLLS